MIREHKVFYGVFFALFMANLAFIFINSFLPAEQSHSISNFFVDIARTVYHFFVSETEPTEGEMEALTGTLVFLVRKAAHLSEFFALGIWATMLRCYHKMSPDRVMSVLLIGIAVPLIDETIQATNDRTSSVTDVWIDFCGFFLAFLIVYLILQKVRAKKVRRS